MGMFSRHSRIELGAFPSASLRETAVEHQITLGFHALEEAP